MRERATPSVCVCAHTTHIIQKRRAHTYSAYKQTGRTLFFWTICSGAQRNRHERDPAWTYIPSEPGACKFELCARCKLFNKFRPCFFDAHTRASAAGFYEKELWRWEYNEPFIIWPKMVIIFYHYGRSGINEGPHRSFWIDRTLRCDGENQLTGLAAVRRSFICVLKYFVCAPCACSLRAAAFSASPIISFLSWLCATHYLRWLACFVTE